MIDSGTIFDLKKYAIHDGPGIRTTVFFKGCSLNCWWCHNPEGRKAEPETVNVGSRKRSAYMSLFKAEVIGQIVTVQYLMEEIRKDVIFYDQSGGGVTISGGEPMMQVEFLVALLKSCMKDRIHTALDTSGYAPREDFEKIYDFVDLFLYDLKIMDDRAHKRYTGVSNKLILENMAVLSHRGEKVVPRIPLIPGITDTEENLDAIVQFLTSLKNIRVVNLLPYNRIGEEKFKRFNFVNKLGHLHTQTDAELKSIGKHFESHGYTVKYGG